MSHNIIRCQILLERQVRERVGTLTLFNEKSLIYKDCVENFGGIERFQRIRVTLTEFLNLCNEFRLR